MQRSLWKEEYTDLQEVMKNIELDKAVVNALETMEATEILYVVNSFAEEFLLKAIRENKN